MMNAGLLHAVLLPAVAAAFLTGVSTPLVRRLALRFGCVAKPANDRWGRRVVSRLGGLAIYVGVLVVGVVWLASWKKFLVLAGGISAIFLVGVLDDLRRMSPPTKLLLQIVVSCFVVIGGVSIELVPWPWLAIPLSVFWFVLVMNAFNLLDNMDGLAVGVGAIAAGFCAFHAVSSGNWYIATMAAIVSGACVGFLYHNFPPATIFMGDSGSHLLGLTLATLALLGSWDHSTQLLSILVVPVLVLAVPIFDACFVTIQRLIHHQHPFHGGTDHVSHRLAILGLTERQTVLSLYGLSAGLGLLSLISMQLTPPSAVVLWLLTMTGLILLGVYLAKVNVYTFARQGLAPSASPSFAHPQTLIETMLLHKRRLLEVFIDFSLICSAYVSAHLLRFEGLFTPELERLIVQSLPLIIAVKLACFVSTGFYRGVWRYVSLPDLSMIFKGVTLSSILSALAVLYLWRFQGYSRAVFVIDWMFCLFAVGGSRIAERLLDEWIRGASEWGVPTLIIGAGDTGERVLRYLQREASSRHRVIGLLDDDSRTHGERIHGCPVLGSRGKLPELLRDHQVREVLVAVADPPGELLQYVRDCCEPLEVNWRVVTAGMTITA